MDGTAGGDVRTTGGKGLTRDHGQLRSIVRRVATQQVDRAGLRHIFPTGIETNPDCAGSVEVVACVETPFANEKWRIIEASAVCYLRLSKT